ncbi:MAG: hypothetical protein AAGG80_05840 [Pseudomonadota bacterium]
MKKILLLACATTLLLTGCATKLTPQQECTYIKRRLIGLDNMPGQEKYVSTPAEMKRLRKRYTQLGCKGPLV